MNEEDALKKWLNKQVHQRLIENLQDVDTVIHIKQNDYALLIVDITETELKEILDQLIEHLTSPFLYYSQEIILSFSVGSCMLPNKSNEQINPLYKAKSAMYKAENKKSRKFSIHIAHKEEQLHETSIIEKDLSSALEKNEFCLHYQPQYHIQAKTIKGVETLLRWNHPQLGQVPPSKFIDLAEEQGLMYEILLWMIKEVCHKFSKEKELIISINLSYNQLLEKSFILDVENIINNSQMDPQNICFELTESINIYKRSEVRKILHYLTQQKYNISIDDFGNGYFSFLDFIDLPINTVKFDRVFSSIIASNSKLREIAPDLINIAHKAELEVVVEGIESIEEYRLWEKFQGDFAQGYYISKPLPYESLFSTIIELNKQLN
ncbi:GGDEF domain-containing phosphodiesterase [Halobacillus litoralis]|uniref:GGDEF domain-containing phosphodiesterase n=1 Tax=Halobacillus litoralis TaxID=45668 RepID=UPI0013704AF4|nr:GGDEF domain-containing phosphodiesterase [Halobacillus litoralis]MYL36384.1 EAL domain-containing protein [Halobacillus litoralis]